MTNTSDEDTVPWPVPYTPKQTTVLLYLYYINIYADLVMHYLSEFLPNDQFIIEMFISNISGIWVNVFLKCMSRWYFGWRYYMYWRMDPEIDKLKKEEKNRLY